MTEPAPLICSICQWPIPVKGTWRFGNSAEPVNTGRCCDACDWKVVIPLRIALMKQEERKT